MSVANPPPDAKGSRRSGRAEPERAAAEPSPPSAPALAIEDVLKEFGRVLSPAANSFADCASAVQEGRRLRRATDRAGITRSVAIWTAAALDTRVGHAMSVSGFDMGVFGRSISATLPPATEIVPQKRHLIEPEFVECLRAALGQNTDVTSAVSVPELAVAILSRASGRVLDRLLDAGGDPKDAVAALSVVLDDERNVRVDPKDFSGSVWNVREQLGPDSVITGSALAAALAAQHSDYAEGRLARVALRSDEGDQATTDEWLRMVAGCYDRAAVRGSARGVIDTKLTLLALAAVDPPVAQALARNGVVAWLREAVDVQPERVRADPTEWSSDSPARIDELGRGPIAKDLAKRISRLAHEDQPDEASFMVHIDGPWGAGKSSMFRFLRAELEDEFIVVDVNAWREQRVGVQWWTLFTALQAELARRASTAGRARLWFVGTLDRIRANWVPFTIAMVLIVAAVIGVLVGLDLTGTSAAADAIVKIVSLATVIFAGLAAVSRYVIPSSRRSAQGIWENSENPTREVARYFLRALSRAPKPVVFLIDDLDRCDGPYVVEFLEVVQTLVRDGPRLLDAQRRSSDVRSGVSAGPAARSRPRGRAQRGHPVVGPFVFVAADGAWIRSSFEEHFKVFGETFEKGRPLGYLFLEKLFQLHVRLPDVTPAARQAYLSRLLGLSMRSAEDTVEQRDLIDEADRAVAQATSESAVLAAAEKATNISDPATRLRVLGQAAEKFSDRAIEESPDHPLADFHPLLEPNPRSMKLFVNAYGIARSMLTVQEQFVPVERLALWTVLEVRWPRLADFLRENPDRAAALQDGAPHCPEDIQRMLDDPQVHRVLDDPRWKGFDPDRVRQCAGVS